MIVFQLKYQHRTIDYGTETSSEWKKNVKRFLPKSSKFCIYILPYDFVKISAACGPDTYQIMYEETLDF